MQENPVPNQPVTDSGKDNAVTETARITKIEPIPNPNLSAEAIAERPKYTTGNIVAFIFVGLVLLSWFLPEGDLAPMLGWPIAIFGVVAGVAFLTKCINQASQSANIFIKIFLVLCGLGIGFVIFIVGVISAFIAGLKDPDVRMS